MPNVSPIPWRMAGEIAALGADSRLRAHRFRHGPTGHTIQLLQLPGAWGGFLDAAKGGVSWLGPLAKIERQRAHYRAAVDALADTERTRSVLIARAQQAALREVFRT